MNKLIFIIMLMFSSISFANKPSSISDFHKTSVRIYNLAMNSGGSGSILRSFKNASHILTNKHVCKLIEPGGIVLHEGKKYIITHYKKFKQHDLCLIRVKANLGVNLTISNTLSKISSVIYVSGHPSLLPHILTKGHLSDRMDIELVVGTKKCTKDDMIKNPTSCIWFGGKPIVKVYDSQVISNLIKPGSSGSAVFNTKGEIVGVVFAGTGRGFSHGFIVPQIYVIYFIQNAYRFNWVKVGTLVADAGVSEGVFDFQKCVSPKLYVFSKFNIIRKFCKSIKDNVIGRL